MSATRMAANPVPVRPEVIEKANAAPELGRPLFTYEHDSDYENLSSDKRLFIARLSVKYGADLLAELFGKVSFEGQALVQSQIRARKPVTEATVKS